ncbi:MAG: lysyl oxidase family protein [Trueperaceae bacterium]|nr:lysyl oxidase family protein [Trueperaceae bacterium]
MKRLLRRRWTQALLAGGSVYLVYALIAAFFLTHGATKSVVAAPAFTPYDAVPASDQIAAQALLASAPGNTNPVPAAALLPDMQALHPQDLHVIGSSSDGSRRLKFTTTIWNAGAGALETRGAENPDTGELEVFQYFYTASGDAVRGTPVGTFDYNHRHGHLHLDTFARYELWSVDGEGNLVEMVASNHKVGFCLMDIQVIDQDLAGDEVYAGCRADLQGISPGYGDEYVAQLYEQDINISRVPDGNYALVNIANPDFAMAETDYSNNAAATYLRLVNRSLVPYNGARAEITSLLPQPSLPTNDIIETTITQEDGASQDLEPETVQRAPM